MELINGDFLFVMSSTLQERAFYDLWDQLKYQGILDGRLINHVWEKFKTEDRQRLLDVMEQFDLICSLPVGMWKEDTPAVGYTEAASDTRISARTYYVPSLFNPEIVNKREKLASATSLTFYVDIKGSFTS